MGGSPPPTSTKFAYPSNHGKPSPQWTLSATKTLFSPTKGLLSPLTNNFFYNPITTSISDVVVAPVHTSYSNFDFKWCSIFYRMLLLALKKVQKVKINPHHIIINGEKNSLSKISHSSQWDVLTIHYFRIKKYNFGKTFSSYLAYITVNFFTFCPLVYLQFLF